MKLKIVYDTKEREWLSKTTYRNVQKEAELTPVEIIRKSCGNKGLAKNRFYYFARFLAPDDAEFVSNGKIETNIFRKDNPQFNPKKLDFINNFCVLSKDKNF